MSEKEYWNNYYIKSKVPFKCSTFAQSILSQVQKKKNNTLLELGCGNGRDATFFAKNGMNVTAIDIAEEEILILKEKNKGQNTKFIATDFTNLNNNNNNLFEKQQFGTIYSRFTLHSIHKEGASKTLKWSFENLEKGGTLFIEVRSIKDELYGQGMHVENERDAYITSHYRRFIRKDELLNELTSLGFEISFVQEEDNLAIYKDDNPIVIRIHAIKQ